MPIAACVASLAVLSGLARAQIPHERPPINYSASAPTDPVALLQSRLQADQLHLDHEAPQGYLRSVLQALDVPVSSQVLVFSKTSFQSLKITPRTPRALYFNDDVYVGYVPRGDVLEFAAVDPDLGAVFYVMDQDKAKSPEFGRANDCLQCHLSSRTLDVPGHLLRSVFPEPSGQPSFKAGTYNGSQESPFEERWGGWYVTGTHGRMRHMGNAIVTDHDRPREMNRESGANLTDLSKKLDPSIYLEPGSDIVALMVLQHQIKLHNLITLTNYQAKLALQYAQEINKALGEPEGTLSESTARRFQAPAEELLKYMLCVEEAPIVDPIKGTSQFAQDFTARGPRDSKGRSLRDLDLNSRLLRYPCSYLIYSKSFEKLPPIVKTHILKRLWEVLTGRDRSKTYANLTADDRQAILEILRETLPNLPDYWKTS